jgi:hypothetical protein
MFGQKSVKVWRSKASLRKFNASIEKRICQSEKNLVAGTYSTVERFSLLAVLANVLTPMFITAP